jgi:hypothetical protein
VWWENTGREPSIAEVDSTISTKLPDPPKNSCTKDSLCSKKYTKPFCSETAFDAGGYLLYRRRDNGIIVMKNNIVTDNHHVDPHNLVALKKYQCHINVEACNKVPIQICEQRIRLC